MRSSTSFSLVASDLVRSHGPHLVLDGVSLSVGPESRIGIVGPNGAGKSTLLRVLAGIEHPDVGRVTHTPPGLRVGYLPQELEHRDDETVLGSLARRSGVAAAEAALERAAQELATGRPDADTRYSEALDGLVASGAPDFRARVMAVAADLGLGEEIVEAHTATLSGGQTARVALAAILLSRYDVHLLDEPTNDLDFDGLDRLERFVRGLAGGVVIVSHDRAFLESTVTRVVELDPHSREATEYAGGFQAYLEARAVARRHAEEEYARYQTERARLGARAQRQRQWATRGVRRASRDANEPDKFIKHFRVTSSEQLAAKAKATERAIDRIDPVEKPWEPWELRLDIAEAPRSGARVARLERAVVARDGFTLGPVDLEVHWADRVAITGANGAGKTTLLDALLARIPLAEGEQWIGPGVVVGGMDQVRHAFTGDRPLLDLFLAATGDRPSEARSRLAKFGLGTDHVLRPTGSLSPGERTRAALALFAARGVNCLVLDEPTNHLDLEAIEQLEQALDRFDGTLLLVTHDRRLLDTVRTTRTIEVVAGRIARDG
jgi:ATPase subunit of ABC transporter with duplicated ATPase domains